MLKISFQDLDDWNDEGEFIHPTADEKLDYLILKINELSRGTNARIRELERKIEELPQVDDYISLKENLYALQDRSLSIEALTPQSETIAKTSNYSIYIDHSSLNVTMRSPNGESFFIIPLTELLLISKEVGHFPVKLKIYGAGEEMIFDEEISVHDAIDKFKRLYPTTPSKDIRWRRI